MRSGSCVNLADALDQPGFVYRPVLRISRPSVWSRRTRKTSNREAATSSLSDPTETSMAHHDP